MRKSLLAASYCGPNLQTRGSIPLVWSQYPNLKYKPDPRIKEDENQEEALGKHFAAQVFTYGKQIVINLVSEPVSIRCTVGL